MNKGGITKRGTKGGLITERGTKFGGLTTKEAYHEGPKGGLKEGLKEGGGLAKRGTKGGI